jgi:anti-sigma regulatory factor (Ser/Thr protein kinase)/serine/threonine protein phosphatase PrpC
MQDISPVSTERCVIADTSQISSARRLIVERAGMLGFSEARCNDIGIVVSEAGTNLIRHGNGGEILLRVSPGELDLLALDRGTGRNNIEECMRDGYSTGSSPGNGLGAMQRLATNFDIYSRTGRGTVVAMSFSLEAPDQAASRATVGAVSLPRADEQVCGDAWDLIRQADRTLIVIADGLGHGPDAHHASTEAVRVFRQNQQYAPGALLETIHAALRSTRGAAVLVVELDTEHGLVRVSGVGNCAATIVRPGYRRGLVSMNGTAGQGTVKAKEFTQPWDKEDTLILQSDGIVTHWDLENYPGILMRNPALTAGVLYRDYSRGRDDLTVLAVRTHPH